MDIPQAARNGPDVSLSYEVRGGRRFQAKASRSHRGFVMLILEPDGFLSNIEGHARVALFSQNGQGEPISARFYVEDIGPAVRERCDASEQESWVVSTSPSDEPAEPATTFPRYITGNVTEPELIGGPEPQYTVIARAARIQGVVILQATISERGDVSDIKVLKGLSYGLTEAAVAAAKQWKYKPATLDGMPVAVYHTLTVSFGLQ